MQKIQQMGKEVEDKNMITKQEAMERLITTDIDVESLYPTFARGLYVPTSVMDAVHREILNYITNDIYTTKEAVKTMRNSIKKIIFNDPATIIIWGNGDKTIVKCGEGETYDPEKGMAMAIAKHFLGDKGNYYETFKKWLPKEHETVKESKSNTERLGENHHSHKLTRNDVDYIRSVYSKRDPHYGAVALAKKFGVDRTTIFDVVNRKTWRYE